MRFRLGVYKAIASIVAAGGERTNQRGTAGNRRPKSPLREDRGEGEAIKLHSWLKTKDTMTGLREKELGERKGGPRLLNARRLEIAKVGVDQGRFRELCNYRTVRRASSQFPYTPKLLTGIVVAVSQPSRQLVCWQPHFVSAARPGCLTPLSPVWFS